MKSDVKSRSFCAPSVVQYWIDSPVKVVVIVDVQWT